MARATEKIKVRGLALLAVWLLGCWGVLVLAKGVFDRFLGGEPEANLYAPAPWAFVTKSQWARYASFELAYGLACLAAAWLCWRFSRRLPDAVERPRREPEFSLFG